MTPNTQVRIWWDTSVQAYRMSSPFNKTLVDSIKQFIPVSDRSYDPASKIWTFVERQLAPLQTLFKQLHIQPQIITRAQAEQAANANANANAPARRGQQLDTIALEFMRALPYEAAQKAYRHAAMMLHPDRGGDPSKMASLNSSWTKLQKELYGQQ